MVRQSASGRPGTDWAEIYMGGDPIVEARLIKQFVHDIKEVQTRLKARERAPVIRRAFHAKIHAGITNAQFQILPDLPDDLRIGFFQPGKSYTAIIRFSNASGGVRPDSEKDLRGVAVKVITDDGAHDFLMTNAPVSHARNARQFMIAAKALASRTRLVVPFKLVWGVGLGETIRMLKNLRRGARKVDSMATEQYWSRAPIAFGPYAARYTLRPAPETAASPARSGDNFLREDLRERLRQGPLRFEFCIQRYVDDVKTPIEDGAVEWKLADSPFEPIAEIIIPPQDLGTVEAKAEEERVNNMEFNPWHTIHELRPLGSLNRARKLVYESSAAHWAGRTQFHPGPTTGGFFARLLGRIFAALNRIIPWHRLPTWLGILNLYTIRNTLRKYNLHDTSTPRATAQPEPFPPILHPEVAYERKADGTGNDLSDPKMGAAGTRFGRNLPLDRVKPKTDLLMTPNPRTVSRVLMTRDTFIPAETLNLLAAAWIQFQTHDWFNHGNPNLDEPVEIPLARDDPWPQRPMRIGSTPKDPTRTADDDGLPPTYINPGSHWWDASQIYGSDAATMNRLRTSKDGTIIKDGKLVLVNDLLPVDDKGAEMSGFTDNWWIGLSLLHTLFAREHNAICDRLRREYPYWPDDRIYHTARLVNAALMAKIHTVEWTTGILSHPALQVGMNANWWGLAGEQIKKMFGRLSKGEGISGIVGSPTEHHTAPYSLTEEFASVYRLHPLIPDEVVWHSAADGQPLKRIDLREVVGMDKVRRALDGGLTMADVCYSFGISHPGAITLHNFPRFLQQFESPNGLIDLAAIDVLRDRERGIPRYNEFRELMHLPRVSSFDKLTDNPVWAREIEQVYEGKIDNVDLIVGMFAETPPKGFGFSDTAFRIFVLMASRRLKSDRFFTTDYTPEVYTQVGLDWVDDNNMSSVLLRHFPSLAPALRGVKNAFAPWARLEQYKTA